MAYIAPDSDITLYAGLPITSSYNYAPWFSSLSEQTAFFDNLTLKGVFHGYTFIDGQDNRKCIKLNRPFTANNYRWQYLSYTNSAFGNKRIYAFITDIEYVNNNEDKIYFEIDALQTFMFDFDFHECYIERNTIPAGQDVAGTNVEAENLDLGAMTADNGTKDTPIANLMNTASGCRFNCPYAVVIWSTINSAGIFPDVWDGGEVSGVYSGLKPVIFAADDIGGINDWVSDCYTFGMEESLVSATLIPTRILGTADPIQPYIQKMSFPFQKGTIVNYVPRNQKIFTYPYIGLVVHDGAGRSKVYRPELFDGYPNSNCEFLIVGHITPNPQLVAYPINYAGEANKNIYGGNAKEHNRLAGYAVNYNHAFYMTDFPSVTLPIASFVAYLANSLARSALTLTGAAIGGAIGGPAGAMIGGGAASALTAGKSSSFAQMTSPDNAGSMAGMVALQTASTSFFDALASLNTGTANNDSSTVSIAMRNRDFYFEFQSIRLGKVMRFDNYFDEYGYAINDVQIPDVRSNLRTKQYIKTRNCTISGNAPSFALRQIENIFNHGIKLYRGAELTSRLREVT